MSEIVRKPLLSAAVNLPVTKVDVRQITFAPGQKTGRHLHPCPVVGYIAEGAAVLQVEGQPTQTLATGSAFYEPANVNIARFENASSSAPLRFIAYYLLNGEQELIQLLPES